MATNKKTIEVSQNAIMFVGVLLMAMMGFSGYLYGKVNTLEKAAKAAPAQQADTTQQQPAVQVSMDQVKELFNDKNIAFGKKDSKVLFVEFSDPSCPFCHVAAGKNSSLNKQMGEQFVMKKDGGSYLAPVEEMKSLVDKGKAGFVWMYANGHGNGEMGTKAFYCAKEKGKFWEVHDLLMSDKGYTMMNETIKNDKTKSGELAEFLKSAVNPAEMKACLDSGKYDNRMSEDMAVATKFGFSGTPSFFVNTTNFAGAYSFSDMQSAVDKAL